MNPLICRVELLMFPLERQDAFLPLMSDIHPQLTSLTTSAGADNFTWEAHEPQITLGKLIVLRVRNL